MERKKLGHAFSGQIINVLPMSCFKGSKHPDPEGWKDSLLSNYSPDKPDEHQTSSVWRRIFLLSVFIIFYFVLFIRIFHLQVVEGPDWRSIADSNRIKVKVIHAPRGVIYDRNGVILAQNEPGFRLIDASGEAHQITRDEALKMEVSNDPQYQNLEIDSIRSYPLGPASAHIIGYMGEITSKELKDPNFQNYKIGDQVGRSGIEEVYEKVLKGTDGGEIYEVDAQGNKVRTLREVNPIPGQNIYLTIDARLQQYAYSALENGVKKAGSCCGALVAEDPKSGQILALASYPSFDPKNVTPALLDPNSPMLDRAISGTYPPGSTFKIASALAGLSSGKITPQTTFEDTGVMSLGPYTFANWYFTQYGRKEQGPIDIVRAIKRSNDIYFYNLGEAVGENILGQVAKKLGMGNILGIDLPGEAKGLVPDDAWKEKNIGTVWYPGDTLHEAIGQGYLLATPLQILNLTSTIAADGRQYPPHLALKITSPENDLIKQFKFDSFQDSQFPQADIQLVKKGMEEVPKTGGTAWPFFTFTIPTAGKTGTAEFGDPKDRTHAWYTSFAPADNPQIALTVLVEAGGEGSNVSAPIAKQIYTWWFSKDKNRLQNFDTVIPIATDSAKTLGE